MAHSKGPILVHTNAIIEAYRVKGWSALTHGYRIDTVEDRVEETQTGFRHRSAEQQIDARELRSSLTKIHVVENKERADFVLRTQGIALDRGEESLWAHALGRDESWVPCRPDKVSMGNYVAKSAISL